MSYQPPQANNVTRFFRFNQLVYDINWACLRSVVSYIRGRTLDIGCGQKPYRELIEPSCTQYIGIDLLNDLGSWPMIDVCADASVLPFRSNSFDTVVAFQVLEHIPEPHTALGEMGRVLRPEGYVILTTPLMWGLHEEPRDFYRYTRYGLVHLLERAGFQDIQIVANTGFWTMAGLRLNYHLNSWAGRASRLLQPLYLMVQCTVPRLDKVNWTESDTASYTTIGRKPK